MTVKKEKAARGQHLETPRPRDNSSYNVGPDDYAMGGSVSNLSHSIEASANPQGTGHNKKNRFS